MTSLVISSLWRNDAQKFLEDRAAHLLAKTYAAGTLRWVWVVGDCSDDSARRLVDVARAHPDKDIEVVQFDTGIVGDDYPTRLKRFSVTANAAFDRVRPTDDRWLIHESDLRSEPDIAERLMATGKPVVAGWVTLGETLFYDIWAYRKGGVMFTNEPPYHACYKRNQVFEVDSVGSVWLFPAEELRKGVRCYERGCIELCEQMKAHGLTVWVDPTVRIVQPVALWVSQPIEG